MNTHHAPRLAVLAIAAAFALTGCSTDDATATPEQASAAAVTISDPWVKAADDGMTAAFGELSNSGDTDVTVVSATSESSDTIELHETVASDSGGMEMRQKEGGFTIPAGESLMLEPGGNHLMLLGLTAPLAAGDEATFSLTFSDDSTFEFTAPAKDFAGANETYEEGDPDMDMDMDEGN